MKIRVYTAKDKSNRGRFALDVCCRTLPFYAKYFDIAYPLPKMDLVAIPDFAAGAMENWGLVTYREAMLLVDDNESSAGNKEYVALVVGHECAHMWFGNLVTMDWWTDLWLNEGFATWIEYLCVDYCYPEFDIWVIILLIMIFLNAYDMVWVYQQLAQSGYNGGGLSNNNDNSYICLFIYLFI